MFSKVETLFWAFMRGFCGGVNKVSPSLILTEKGFLGGFVPLITFFSHQQKYTGGAKNIYRGIQGVPKLKTLFTSTPQVECFVIKMFMLN